MNISFKRVFDVVGAIIAIFIFFPCMMLIALLVRIKLGRGVLFVQQRSGKDGQPFHILKFRSMLNERDSQGNLKADNERLTTFGAKLRSSSLDELPALVNVLRGEMSLVGPRPLLMEYLPLYSAEQARRHEIRPGVTGWAQVNGRNAISWDEKLALDVWYVKNRSLWLDMKIIWLTIRKVVNREGISASGEVTMSKFTGSKS